MANVITLPNCLWLCANFLFWYELYTSYSKCVWLFCCTGSGPVSSVTVSDVPVVSCVPLVMGVGVCSGETLYSLAADKESVTVSQSVTHVTQSTPSHVLTLSPCNCLSPCKHWVTAAPCTHLLIDVSVREHASAVKPIVTNFTVGVCTS